MRKKPYNALDQRQNDFDKDYTEFNNNVADLHNQIAAFMEQKFNNTSSTYHAVILLQKFERYNCCLIFLITWICSEYLACLHNHKRSGLFLEGRLLSNQSQQFYNLSKSYDWLKKKHTLLLKCKQANYALIRSSVC